MSTGELGRDAQPSGRGRTVTTCGTWHGAGIAQASALERVAGLAGPTKYSLKFNPASDSD